MDPLFTRIGKLFIEKQQEVFGTDHLYNCDPFNEMLPPSNDPSYLKSVSEVIYQSMSAADSQALIQ